jgi:hypothetical protein
LLIQIKQHLAKIFTTINWDYSRPQGDKNSRMPTWINMRWTQRVYDKVGY